ncbi:MAG TPA: GntR family transcriptional regulator [Pseudolysinimonas sp.]|nr:GntR family transcriptional regulator [Pseudolysinimonas sp.]
MATGTLSKSARAYDFVAERIHDGRYSPGYRLVLDPIAQELGTSVVPVREAIRRLEAEGLVTFEHNVGAQVALVHEEEYVTTMQTLSIVEGAATALAAPYLTAGDIARARAINAQMIAMLDDFDAVRFTQLNLDFHAVLFERCPNAHIVDLVERGWARLKLLRESTFSFVPGRARGSVEEHENILQLIEQHADPLEIELTARRHRTTTMDAYLTSRHH